MSSEKDPRLVVIIRINRAKVSYLNNSSRSPCSLSSHLITTILGTIKFSPSCLTDPNERKLTGKMLFSKRLPHYWWFSTWLLASSVTQQANSSGDCSIRSLSISSLEQPCQLQNRSVQVNQLSH